MAANIDVDRFKQVSVDEALKMAVAQLNKDGKPIEKMDFVKAGEPAKDKDGQEMDTKDGLPEVTNKNSVMMLNEKRKGLVYKLINEVGEGPNKSWTMTVELDGETFEGTGRSKRHAKSECAKHALIKLYNIMVVPDEPTSEEQAAQVVQYKVTVTTGEGADNGTTAQAWIKMMSPRRKHTGRHQLKLPEGEIFTPGSVKTFTFEAHAMNAIRKIEAWIKMMSPRRKHTGRHQLKLPEGESFTPGSVKTFTFEAHAMNAIRKIEIGHDGTTESQNWYVKKVTVEMINKELSYDFTAECWINHEVAEETKMDTGEGEGAKAAAKKEKFKKWKWGESKSAKIFTVDGYVPGPPPRVKTAKEDSEEGAEERMARKRSLDAEGGGPTKKKVKQVSQTQTKNALMHLYELKPGLQFQLISQTGPIHSPTFTMSVEVNGQTFVGSGNSKKAAKAATAESALKSFVQFPNASDAHVALGRDPVVNVDFTSDNPDLLLQNFDSKEQMDIQVPQLQTQNGTCMPNGQPVKSAEGKHPVVVLNELKPNLKYSLATESGENHTKTFTISVEVDGEKFEGTARNKKMAKARAAQAALTKLFNLSAVWGNGAGAQPVMNNDTKGEGPSALADHISKVILAKFAELTDGLKSQYARRKVMAGVVLTLDDDLESAKVLCITTGTKCINGEYLSHEGMSVNDFHAEILSRRALLRYLYSQMDLIASGDSEKVESSIFEKSEDSDLYQLKKGYRFHLYISTAPCGDSRIFSPHEQKTGEEGENDDKHPNRKARGQLRTKIESGEGTIPVKSSSGIQTWDGVMQGERLLTMSCSDKLARWNLLGIQGSLLNHFIKPIYFETLILGSLYHSQHLARAVYGRLITLKDASQPFVIHKPNLSGISNPEERQVGKAPNFAVNWSDGDAKFEVLSTLTGKLDSGSESILCKKNMFKRFMKLVEKLPNKSYKQFAGLTYAECKQKNEGYQANKNKMFQHFIDAGLGQWVKKPLEQDQFGLLAEMES